MISKQHNDVVFVSFVNETKEVKIDGKLLKVEPAKNGINAKVIIDKVNLSPNISKAMMQLCTNCNANFKLFSPSLPEGETWKGKAKEKKDNIKINFFLTN